METLCNVAKEVAEGSMKKATIGAKEYIVKNGLSEVPPEADLSKEKKWTLMLELMALGDRGVGPRNREL